MIESYIPIIVKNLFNIGKLKLKNDQHRNLLRTLTTQAEMKGDERFISVLKFEKGTENFSEIYYREREQ